MNMNPIIQQGLEKGLIKLDNDQKYITYVHQNKRRNYADPEEQVQAETYLKLILVYGYAPARIQLFVNVPMGSTTKEADLVVYHDDAHEAPYIVVECKHQEVSEQEFKQAVEQAFSYAHSIAGMVKYVWVTKGIKEEFYLFNKEKNERLTQPDIPYFGESGTKKYRYAKTGVYRERVKGQLQEIKVNDIQKVSESELTRLFKQAHDALWGGGELQPAEAFDELDKLIFCKLWDEKNTYDGQPYQFQIINETENDPTLSSEEKDMRALAALHKRILALYNKGLQIDPEVFNKPIDLSPKRIRTIVQYFQGVDLLNTDLDCKGRAFETFLGSYFRGEFGQFFTPRNIVKFMVEVLPITNHSRMLDPACGSGGFLLHALNKIREQANQLYNLANPKNVIPHRDYWHDFAKNRLFGIEINDRISRVAKMNMILHDDGHTNVIAFDGLYQIAHIAETKKNYGFAENSFDFIVTNPPFGSVIRQSEKAYMKNDETTAPYYDFSLKEINWIEARLKSRHRPTPRDSQSSEVLFIEQAHHFLRDGGILAIVLPDGILTNSTMQYVRDGIAEKFRIVGVVSLPQTAFSHTGATVKSSLLFLKKYSSAQTEAIRQAKQELQDHIADTHHLVPLINAWEDEKRALKKDKTSDPATKTMQIEELNEQIQAFCEELEELYQTEKSKLRDYPIFMAIVEYIGYDATGKSIPQNDLPEIATELKAFIEAVDAGQDHFFA